MRSLYNLNNLPHRTQELLTDPIIHRSFKGNTDTITSCLFTPDLKQAITGSEDGHVFVWNFKQNMRPFKFIGHKGAVNEVTINPLGNIIASCSNDESVRLWTNTVNGKSQLLKGHTGPVRSVDFSMDSRLILTGSNDKTLRLFSLSEKRFISAYIGHNNWVRCARFTPDARLIGSCSDDNTVKLWDVTKKNVVHTFLDHLEDVNTVRFSPDGTCLASGSADRKIKIFDIRSGRVIQHYDAHGSSVTCLSYHPSGKYLISSSMDSTIKIWDLVNGQILYTMHGHEGPICSVAFSKCGEYFCSGGADAVLMVWKSNFNSLTGSNAVNSKMTTTTQGRKVVKGKNTKMKNTTNTNMNEFNNSNNNNTNGCSKMKTGKMNSNLKATTTNMPVMQQHNEEQMMNGTFKSNASCNSQGSNVFNKLPEELTMTFEKLISQLELVTKTMKIMDHRIQNVENQVAQMYNRERRGIYKQYMDDDNDNDNEEGKGSQMMMQQQDEGAVNGYEEEKGNYDYNNNNNMQRGNEGEEQMHELEYQQGEEEEMYQGEEEGEEEAVDNEVDKGAFQDTMKYYKENFEMRNVFDENLAGKQQQQQQQQLLQGDEANVKVEEEEQQQEDIQGDIECEQQLHQGEGEEHINTHEEMELPAEFNENQIEHIQQMGNIEIGEVEAEGFDNDDLAGTIPFKPNEPKVKASAIETNINNNNNIKESDILVQTIKNEE